MDAASSPGDVPVTAALIVAAGRGVRAGGGLPKQYRELGGTSVIAHAMAPFLAHDGIGIVRVVIHPDDQTLYQACVRHGHAKLAPSVDGGASRQESVRRGLEALAGAGVDRVLIHDAVRPFVDAGLIDRVLAGLDGAAAVLPAVPVADSLKRVSGGKVAGSASRDGLWAAQTPQGFRFNDILAAHRAAAAAEVDVTDDCGIAEWAGMEVVVVDGAADNVKLTRPDDFAMAADRLAARFETRVGTGYDVHALGPGESVTLGGVRIPFDHALVGHSDADVALHALTDAILGALAEDDIGAHFPPSDPAWRGAASDRFLADAVERTARRGGRILHLDLSIIAEAPRIGPHRLAMRERIAAICGVAIDRVAVKATTNERLGFIGRGEGIAAIATATLSLPTGRPA